MTTLTFHGMKEEQPAPASLTVGSGFLLADIYLRGSLKNSWARPVKRLRSSKRILIPVNQILKAGLKLAALAALVLSCACVTTGTKAVTDKQLVSGLEAGKSTRADVFTLLGNPAQVSYPKEGEEVWKYYYITEYPRLPELLPILYIFVDGFNQRSQVLTVTFNKDGKVNNVEPQLISGPYQGIPY